MTLHIFFASSLREDVQVSDPELEDALCDIVLDRFQVLLEKCVASWPHFLGGMLQEVSQGLQSTSSQSLDSETSSTFRLSLLFLLALARRLVDRFSQVTILSHVAALVRFRRLTLGSLLAQMSSEAVGACTQNRYSPSPCYWLLPTMLHGTV